MDELEMIKTIEFYNINKWDDEAMKDSPEYKGPVSNWDVSNIERMIGMFSGCSSFNQPLDKWDVSKLRYMSDMFVGCTSFNQPLDNWNVSNVRNMTGMFGGCSSFDQPLHLFTFQTPIFNY
jgi:surface protein